MEAVDGRVVVNPVQARELLAAVTYVGRRGRGERLAAFFACMYFAALRPGEALGLRERDCHLPRTGWGRLTLEKSVDVLLKVYAKCIDGQEATVNKRIEAALGEAA